MRKETLHRKARDEIKTRLYDLQFGKDRYFTENKGCQIYCAGLAEAALTQMDEAYIHKESYISFKCIRHYCP